MVVNRSCCLLHSIIIYEVCNCLGLQREKFNLHDTLLHVCIPYRMTDHYREWKLQSRSWLITSNSVYTLFIIMHNVISMLYLYDTYFLSFFLYYICTSVAGYYCGSWPSCAVFIANQDAVHVVQSMCLNLYIYSFTYQANIRNYFHKHMYNWILFGNHQHFNHESYNAYMPIIIVNPCTPKLA